MRTVVYSSCSAYPVILAKKIKAKPPKDPDHDVPRIKSNVKQSLRLLKAWEYHKRTNEPKPVSRYRKKKSVKQKEEELPEDTELYNTDQDYWEEMDDFVILVDGYNVCGYWDKLSTDFKAGRLELVREKLIDYIIMYSKVREVKVVVVFDAVQSGLRTHKESVFGVDVVFSGKVNADIWISKEVEILRSSDFEVLVVTSDVCEQNETLDSGAFIWSCKTFVEEMQDSEEEFKDIVKTHRRKISQELAAEKERRRRKYGQPMAVPALKSLKNKLLNEELGNKPPISDCNVDPSSLTESTLLPVSISSTNGKASINPTKLPHLMNESTSLDTNPNTENGSSRKLNPKIVRLKTRGYGSLFYTLNDLKKKIDDEEPS